jgi:Protein of unknown function (DUF726)
MSSIRDEDVRLLETGGLVGACAASLGNSDDWPAPFLRRVYSQVGLEVPTAAVRVLINDACALASAVDVVPRAAALATAHAKQLFEVGGGIRVIQKVLAADVLMSGTYDARSRETCMRILGSLELPPRVLFDAEREISTSLSQKLLKTRSLDFEDGSRKDDLSRRSRSRWLKIGGATVIGGMALGISGGLLAPALIPALGSLGLAGAVGISGTSATVAVGSLFGVAGASIGGNAMANRTGEVKEFVFEKCASVPSIGNATDIPAKSIAGKQGCGVVTPEKPNFNVSIALQVQQISSGNGTPPSPTGGGMFVWEFTTSQTRPMVVPAGIRFGVTFEPRSADPFLKATTLNAKPAEQVDWIYPEEELDAGGVDKLGNGKLNRHTGALTIVESGDYVLRWRLLPGSLAVDIQYRYAHVPPGVDPPVFIMKEQGQEDVNVFNGLSTVDRPRSLSVVIFVPGLLQQGANYEAPGVIVDQFATPKGAVACLQRYDVESFGLRWETKQLADVSTVLNNVVGRFAVRVAAQEGARILAPALVGALALPVSLVMAMRGAIDNVWATTLSRARSAASLLAASLPEFGRRPITLAGYSAGAGMIFWALEELARKNRVGLVHDVYLIGAPIPCDVKRWESVRAVVSGRFVNGYWPGDWFLEVAQRTTSFSSESLTRIAGTSPVRLIGGSIENVDLTGICKSLKVSNHSDFAAYGTQIFVALGLGNGDRRRAWPCAEEDTEELKEDSEHMEGYPVNLASSDKIILGADDVGEEDVDWDGQWIRAEEGPSTSSANSLEVRECRISSGACIARSFSDQSLSTTDGSILSGEGLQMDGGVPGDVVVFTNRNRRHVQSEPPPLSR